MFLVLAEYPAIISILKRFITYSHFFGVLIFFIALNIENLFLFFPVDSFFPVFGANQTFLEICVSNLGVVMENSNVLLNTFLIKLFVSFEFLTCLLLLVFFYLNSYLLYQKFNKVNKFRGNDLIPDTLDFDHDGESRVMWKI